MNRKKKPIKAILAAFVAMALIAAITPVVQAEEVIEQWVELFDARSSPSAMVTDSAGNVYVAGYTTGADRDFLTVAYDSSGTVLWSKTYDGQGGFWGDGAHAIATDNNGNVYVTGWSYVNGYNDCDFATVAYGPGGEELWVKRYDGPDYIINGSISPSSEGANAIAVDSTGNVYVTGRGRDLVDPSRASAITVKYSSSGEELWVKSYFSRNYGFESPEGTTIAFDSADNVIVGGKVSTRNEPGGLLLKYNPAGDLLWDIPPWWVSELKAIAFDSADNIFVTGQGMLSCCGTNDDYVTIAFDPDGVWWKYDPFVNLWMAKFDGGGEDQVASMVLDSADNIIVSGTSSKADYTREFVTVSFDSSGNENWLASYQYGTDDSVAADLAIDNEDNIYVTGSAAGGISTVAYDAFGTELWSTHYEGARARFVDVDSDSNVFVVGDFDSPVYFQQMGVIKYSWKNKPPVAVAGVNQTAECAGPTGAAVTLDGSGASDPDEDPLTYTWEGPFGTVYGEIVNVSMPLGTNTVTLTVDDGNGGIDSDTVDITVEDTTPPVVSSASLSGYELSEAGLYLSDVLFEMVATDTCSGVANVSYFLDGTHTTIPGNNASTTVSSGGDHSIAYEALDNAGNLSEVGNLTFSLFEANTSGLRGLTDYFLTQGLIEAQMETSLKAQTTSDDYAAFINHVEAQSGEKIDPVAAQVLIEAAQSIMGN